MIQPTLRDQDTIGHFVRRVDGNISTSFFLRNEAVEVVEATEVIEAAEVSDAREITQ